MSDQIVQISQAGANLIIKEEVSDRSYYEAHEIHPTWPGGRSGVTIACGYDLGYANAAEIASTWSRYLPPEEIKDLQSVAGITGRAAASHAHELHYITVSWDDALQVFLHHDLPKWIEICDTTLLNFQALPLDSRGALVSLAFNRGDSWRTPAAQDPVGRYREMRNIKNLMANQQFDGIPEQILLMRRLWPVDSDLWLRRKHEADLFQRGLDTAKQALQAVVEGSQNLLPPSPSS